MFLKKYEDSVVKGTKTVSMYCDQCDNTSNHVICIEHVVGMGVIFIKNPILSVKRYWLTCPICKNASKQLTKDQVNAYRLN